MRTLSTLCDFMRYAVSRFNAAGLVYGHGTTNAFDEAAFLIMETLHLPPDQSLEPFWGAALTAEEAEQVMAVIDARVTTRKPAPYLVKRAYVQGIPFYVDERVIVPRSFIGELLCTDGGLPLDRAADTVSSVLDLCTGSGCLAILAAHIFPNAHIDAADIDQGAVTVAERNVRDSGFADRITVHQGDLFAPVKDRRYDLVLTNPPYVDLDGMNALPPEYRCEPALALGETAGEDGLAIVRCIIEQAAGHLNDGGALVCELGRCGPALAEDRPGLDFLWLDTENAHGEVFMLTREQLLKEA